MSTDIEITVVDMTKVILRTLDGKVATALVKEDRYLQAPILFEDRVFRRSFDREFDPVYIEQPVIKVSQIDFPVERPAPTSAHKEVKI